MGGAYVTRAVPFRSVPACSSFGNRWAAPRGTPAIPCTYTPLFHVLKICVRKYVGEKHETIEKNEKRGCGAVAAIDLERKNGKLKGQGNYIGQ